jgi:hypothetical protein
MSATIHGFTNWIIVSEKHVSTCVQFSTIMGQMLEIVELHIKRLSKTMLLGYLIFYIGTLLVSYPS